MREDAVFALNADWKNHTFVHLEACLNVYPTYPFLQGALACAFSFIVKFGKGVLHVFLNDIVQEDFCLLYVHLWMNVEFICQYFISKHSLTLCSSLSKFHVPASTQHQAQVNIFSHWQGFSHSGLA